MFWKILKKFRNVVNLQINFEATYVKLRRTIHIKWFWSYRRTLLRVTFQELWIAGKLEKFQDNFEKLQRKLWIHFWKLWKNYSVDNIRDIKNWKSFSEISVKLNEGILKKPGRNNIKETSQYLIFEAFWWKFLG